MLNNDLAIYSSTELYDEIQFYQNVGARRHRQLIMFGINELVAELRARGPNCSELTAVDGVWRKLPR